MGSSRQRRRQRERREQRILVQDSGLGGEGEEGGRSRNVEDHRWHFCSLCGAEVELERAEASKISGEQREEERKKARTKRVGLDFERGQTRLGGAREVGSVGLKF